MAGSSTPGSRFAAANNPAFRAAGGLLASAERELSVHPEAAYVLAYDAARKSLRSTAGSTGTAHQVRRAPRHDRASRTCAVRWPFDAFASLRRRPTEIEYPCLPGEVATTDEAAQAIEKARAIHDAVRKLLTQLTLLNPWLGFSAARCRNRYPSPHSSMNTWRFGFPRRRL